MAVGWARSASGILVARAWTSRGGRLWTAVPVSPPVLPGADDAMTGCSTTVGGDRRPYGRFEAFGTAASPQNGVQPVFWSSADGRSWTRHSADPFGSGLPSPTVAVVRAATVWVATTGAPDPDVTSAAPAVASGLWVSTDAGDNWVQVDTGSSVWQGQLTADLDQVALLGTYPVVAGQVDGRLTVWVGVPT